MKIRNWKLKEKETKDMCFEISANDFSISVCNVCALMKNLLIFIILF